MPTHTQLVVCLAAVLPCVWDAGIVEAGQRPAPQPKQVMRAVRIDGALTIDGRLDEPEWQLAEPAPAFVQKEPRDGGTPSERTEVRILYDDTFLYVAALCLDSEPDKILITDLVEDHQMGQEDSFAILIDSFNDGMTDVLLETNAAGSRADNQHSSNGAVSNRDWDTIWYVKSVRRPDGWAAEFAIPFKSLRFNDISEQVWGINFRRRIRRKNEENVWNRVPRGQNFWTPSLTGRLEGLRDLRPGRSLFLKPYVLSGYRDFRGVPNEFARDAGLDIKYGITKGLTLDVTYRTDFAQADVDQQQVNLTRFNLFFPEKRQFFLENAGIFSFAGQGSTAGGQPTFGSGGGGGASPRPHPFGAGDFILFSSRRIGLSASGRPIPVEGGARVTGRLPGRVDLGVLNITTGNAPGVRASNVSVAKVRKALFRNSDVGAMFIDREEEGPGFNRIVGLDQTLRLLSNAWHVNSFWARTFSPQVTGGDQAWGLSTSWRDRTTSAGVFYREIQAGFDDQVGFVRRRGIRQANGEAAIYLRPAALGRHLREVAPQLVFDHVMSEANTLLTRTVAPSVEVQFHSGAKMIVGRTETFDRVERPFTLGAGVIVRGDYRFGETRVEYQSDESRLFAARTTFTRGPFYGGSRDGVGLGVLFRPNYHLSMRGEYTRNAVDLRSTRFVSHLGLLTANVGFSPDLSLSGIVQYNSDTRQTLTNVRFRYNYRPLNDFFIVYDEARDTFGPRGKDRALTLKLTYALSP